ncbi:SusC/RagA family TonB-linked outer membrane protein [Dyadobacter bucti]|jgi:TonB-linked SusC/RagA family outer membrane protein|uniref:SusC/RagA family TonB-linked outer membrane protein n=1 Tax=Dyadobacter bucti TaxID=2572203 RepID=UPI003F725734
MQKWNINQRLIRLMRLSVIQLLMVTCFLGNVHAIDGYAQAALDQKVNLSVKNQQVESLFREIEKQSDVRFVFSASLIKAGRTVSIRVKGQPIHKVLDEVLAPLDLKYRASDNLVIISRIDKKNESQLKDLLEDAAPGLTRAPAAADLAVEGKVSDESGGGLPGVNILVKGTQLGTVTNAEGNFIINVPDEKTILVFSYIGYVSQEVLISGRTKLDVTMRIDDKSLEEVVVVGYGTQKKRDVIGSISTIRSEVFEKPSSSTNFNSLLQGQAAGVSVQSSSGRLGAPVDIKIRGLSSVSANTSPLWVIDGVPIVTSTGITNNGSSEQSPMNLINPADIQSIDVLKDAAATSIYGSRGSNGVVIVTTKSGKAGKPSLSVGYNTGLSQLPLQKVDFLLDSKKWFEIKDEAKGSFGLGAFTMTDFYSKKVYATEFLTREQAEGISVDWLKKGMRQGNFLSADFSTSGGNEGARYFVSGTYRKDKGVMLGEDLQRYGLRANVDLKPLPSLLIGTKVNVSLSKGNRGKNSAGGVEDGNKSGTAGGFSSLNTVRVPFDLVYSLADPAKYYNPFLGNPIATSDPDNLVESLDQYRALVSLYGEYSIPFVTGLSVRSELSADVIQANRNFWVSDAIRWDGKLGADDATTTKNINYNLYLKYNKSIGDHSLDMVVGTESQRGNRWIRTMQGRGLVGTYQQLGSPALKDNMFSGLSDENMLKSYFGRANYKFKDKYIAGISLRRDGSSVFTADYRWGNFVAFSAGWIVSDEAFMGSFGANNLLKIRGSYGQTGNASIPSKLDVTNYNSGYGYGSADILGTDGTLVSSIGVKNLVWEKTNNLDLGLDFGFFNQRVNGSIAYYNKYVHDLLLQSALPSSAGISTIWGNIGDLVNSGIELSVTSYNLPQTRKFGWSTSLNIAFNHNEVKKLTPQVDKAGTGMVSSPFITKVGYGIREYYLAESAGIDPQTGLRMIYARDQDHYNATGETTRLMGADGKEVTLLANNANMNTNFFHQKGKSAMPTYYGGITNRFTYKAFDLSFLVTFSGGNYILDHAWRGLIQGGGTGYGAIPADFVNNYWKKPGDNAKYQRLDWLNNIKLEDGTIVGMGDPRVPLDQWMFKGDFVKLKSVNIGYTIPSSPKFRKVFQNMRLYCSLENLYTITKYPGWDPEGQGFVNEWDLPQLFAASVGVNVRF